MLSYSAHPGGGTVIFTPPAEIDLSNANQIYDELTTALDRGIRTLIVDMSKTTFCDSAGTAALARAHKRAGNTGADLRLVVPSESYVRRVFEINAMDEILQIYVTVAAAQEGSADNAADPPCRVPGQA
jgi:anti-sigma B factor antagonist